MKHVRFDRRCRSEQAERREGLRSSAGPPSSSEFLPSSLRMHGGKRGLVAPQNTFLENIVRRSSGEFPGFFFKLVEKEKKKKTQKSAWMLNWRVNQASAKSGRGEAEISPWRRLKCHFNNSIRCCGCYFYFKKIMGT